MPKHEVDFIEVRGARVHNLKNVDLDIPLRKLICFAGPSGSGKTSLAFHTLLTESKRRFVNSFPNSMRFFTERPAAVDVDSIFPVLPVFGLPQINPVVGSRTVVSDVMRLTDGLQNLYFSGSVELCPRHDTELIVKGVAEQIEGQLPAKVEGDVFYVLLSPGEFQRVMGESFPVRSFSQKRKSIEPFTEDDEWWEILRFKRGQLGSLEKKWLELKLDKLRLSYQLWAPGMKKPQELQFHFEKVCPKCDFESVPVYSVSAFSPYSALGACPECNGYGANLVYDDEKVLDKELSVNEGALKLLNYGPFQDSYEALLRLMKKKKIPFDVPVKKLPKTFLKLLDEGEGNYSGYADLKAYLQSKKYKPSVRIYIRQLQKEEPCAVCHSSRLNQRIHHYRMTFGEKKLSLDEVMALSVDEARELFATGKKRGSTHEQKIWTDIQEKLNLAQAMGLGHLALLRRAKSLSAGEYQRLLLIKYLSFKGTDSLFVLDEPSVGLAEKELKKVIDGLRQIIDQGNTVILIDHSELVQKESDHLVVMGPASGKGGGEILYEGVSKQFFTEKEKVKWPKPPKRQAPRRFVEVKGAKIHAREYPEFQVPVEEFTWVTGESGAGKTSAIVKVMANELARRNLGEPLGDEKYELQSLKTKSKFDDVILISSDLNRFTSRSTVGTITELASIIRKHFLKLPVAKSMKLKEGHLSPNSELGMCPRCEGKGNIVIEMQYLEDIVLECEDCKGQKIKPLYANISDGKMTVAEAYSLPLSQVLERIDLTPKFRRVWEYLKILNLDYLSLDRSLNSLSGGEKQRIFLLSKLLKRVENSLLIFENISFGLSEKELLQLGTFLQEMIQFKNTIVVIDSNTCFRHLASWHLDFQKEEINSEPLSD